MKKILYKIKLALGAGLKSKLVKFLPKFFVDSMREGEVWVISFPKCGRSWLKLILCDIVYAQFEDFKRVDDVSTELLFKVHSDVPRMLFSHDDNPMLKRSEDLDTDKSSFSKVNLVFLVRDPRDVVVSWYYEHKNRSWNHKGFGLANGSLSEFMHGEVGGLKTIVSFFNLWYEERSTPQDFHLLRYEDLRMDPMNSIRQLLDFCDFGHLIEDDTIEYAIEKNTFEKVKEREIKGEIKNGLNKVIEFGAATIGNEMSLKARKGDVAGYVNEFHSDDLSYMESYLKENLNPVFGYN